MKSLEFDSKNFRFEKAKIRWVEILRILLGSFLTAVVFSCLVLFLFTLFIRTPEEKSLLEKNRASREMYSCLSEDNALVSGAITALQVKDAMIYADVFNSAAPNVDPVGKLDFLFASDTIPDTKLISYVRGKADALQIRAGNIDASFSAIAEILSNPDFVLPPMSLPLDGINYVQVGAAEGIKTHPFYKSDVHHDGLDFIVGLGRPVKASASGIVSGMERSRSGKGNSVTIDHGNGWFTRYSHLSDIKVNRGARVSLGQTIGYSGMSGQVFAPHLHYEVLRDTTRMNPINYIFASVSPGEYANMLFMAANTLQSMD